MSDPSDLKNGAAPSGYGEHMFTIYRNKLLGGEAPPTTTDPSLLEKQAKEVMPEEGFNYVAGGAGEGSTMEANRLAFRQWKLIPRMMRPALDRDMRVELFGHTYESPLLMAPVGVMSAYHQDKELGVASACADLRVPFIISTAASSSIEEIAEHVGNEAPRWFQLYWPRSESLTASLLKRARASGCKVLVVTLDTFTMAWRPRDLDLGYLPFVLGEGNANGFSDPEFRKMFARAQKDKGNQDGDEEITPDDNVIEASLHWISEAFSGEARRWEDIAILKRHWDGPIVLKGIVSVEDAKLALKHGADGIVVSNHGGRQLDGSIASLEVLPEIVDAVGGKMTVLFDSGVRTGADAMKALCLGAKGVLVGRPVIYGLGIAGKEGAKNVLAGLLADLHQSMGLAGIKSVKELTRGMVRRVKYGGDVRSVL